MKPIVISFYTLGTPYEQEVKKLIHSCSEQEIEADIVGIDSKGSWEKNCAQKPFFILEKVNQWNRPVLWVDADAVFKQQTDFSEMSTCDVSVRMNEFLPKMHESRIVSNTLFIKNNSSGLELLEEWCLEVNKALNDKNRTMEFWDQVALRDVLHRNTDVHFLPMPLKYAKIFDFDDLFISDKEVVIEHYQASRRYKHKLDLLRN
jgi:hypothetical protein